MRTAQWLEALGHHVEPSYPEALDDRLPAAAFFPAVIAADVERLSRRIGRPIRLEELEPPNAILADIGRGVTATRWMAELEAMYAWARTISAWWGAHDLLVTPVLPDPPFRLGLLDPATTNPLDVIRGTGERVWFTHPFNDTGQPAISLPLHWTDDGLPVGVQLVAAYGREDVLLRVASQLEAAHPWAHRRPPFPAPPAAPARPA